MFSQEGFGAPAADAESDAEIPLSKTKPPGR